MPRFRFQLDPLLQLRRREEDARRLAVAEIERERRAIEESLRARQSEIASGRTDLRGALVGSLDVTSLRQHAASTIAVQRLAQRSVVALAGLERRMTVARQELLEASTRRRALELLRERREREWKEGLDRAETSRLDELATVAGARRLRERAGSADESIGSFPTGGI